jgi:uncharacterized damage-inducible protein DinB
MTAVDSRTQERADLVQTLRSHRHFLRRTAEGLTDEQATTRSTVSELTVAGIIKHVAYTERRWLGFAQRGKSAMESPADRGEAFAEHVATFRPEPDETLEVLLARYAEVAAETERLIETLDLDSSHELPSAPWFPPGTRWTVRRVLLHLLAETAQHAGHADIVREAIDGQKTMG